jgi:hypothetical protein
VVRKVGTTILTSAGSTAPKAIMSKAGVHVESAVGGQLWVLKPTFTNPEPLLLVMQYNIGLGSVKGIPKLVI